MITGAVKLCCEAASEFGSLAIRKVLFCDQEAFFFGCTPTGPACVPTNPDISCSPPSGDPCPGAEDCCLYPDNKPGTTGFIIPDGLLFNFTENGTGLITVSLSINVTACTTILEGTGTLAPIEGDQIHAFLSVDLRVLGTGCEDEVVMAASPSGMTNLAGTNEWDGVYSLGPGGIGTLACSVDLTLAFGAVTDPVHPCWPRNSCHAGIIFSGYVRAEDNLGAPKDFAITSGSGYGFDLTSEVSGECCGPHDITYYDVDPFPP